MSPFRRVPKRGFSLIELLLVVALIGILAGLALPLLGGFTRRAQMRSTLNQLTADVHYARMLAVRAGQRTELRFSFDNGGECARAYEINVLSTPARQAKLVNVREDLPGLCLRVSTGGNPTIFTSRGMPHGIGRSFWIREGAMVDSLTLSTMGRLRRSG